MANNQGHIFRHLEKPIVGIAMINVVEQAVLVRAQMLR